MIDVNESFIRLWSDFKGPGPSKSFLTMIQSLTLMGVFAQDTGIDGPNMFHNFIPKAISLRMCYLNSIVNF